MHISPRNDWESRFFTQAFILVLFSLFSSASVRAEIYSFTICHRATSHISCDDAVAQAQNILDSQDGPASDWTPGYNDDPWFWSPGTPNQHDNLYLAAAFCRKRSSFDSFASGDYSASPGLPDIGQGIGTDPRCSQYQFPSGGTTVNSWASKVCRTYTCVQKAAPGGAVLQESYDQAVAAAHANCTENFQTFIGQNASGYIFFKEDIRQDPDGWSGTVQCAANRPFDP